MASGTAYNAVLLALDTYLASKGKPVVKSKRGRIDANDYRKQLAVVDKKMLDHFNAAYLALHLDGYYEGTTSHGIIHTGMQAAREIIRAIQN